MTVKGTGDAQTPSPANKKTVFNLLSLKRLTAKKIAEPVESPKKVTKQPVEGVVVKKRPTGKKAIKVVSKPKKPVKLRQILLAKKLSASVRKAKGKKISVSKVMKEVGYSPTYAEKAGRVLANDPFQALLDKYLPDDFLAEAHAGVMKANALAHDVFPLKLTDDEIKEIVENVWGGHLKKLMHGETATHAWYIVPDHKTIIKGISEAYKVKAKYPAEKQEHTFDAEITEALTRLSKMVK